MTRTLGRVVATGIAVALAGVTAVPTQAEAATGTTLYVNGTSAACTDSGVGSQTAPFCTIQAAASAATAGDTVLITGSTYTAKHNLTIAHSGTASAPIVFESTGPRYKVGAVDITGSYVEFSGAQVDGFLTSAITVSGSHVTLDRDFAYGSAGGVVSVGANVTGLTVERSFLNETEDGPAVQLGTGDSDTVISANTTSSGVDAGGIPAFAVNGDSGTDITGNTIMDGCQVGVSVVNSTATSIENNIVGSGVCLSGRENLSVDTTSAATTTEGYNLLSTNAGTSIPYVWAGEDYSTQAAFAAATGQGAEDLVQSSVDASTDAIANFSAAEGDANASAPGELTTDIYGNAWPRSAPDRGAFAIEEFTNSTLYTENTSAQQVGIELDLQGVAWGSAPSLTVNWGDGSTDTLGPLVDRTWTDFTDLYDQHMYAQIGTYTVTETLTDSTQTITKTATVTTGGSTYVPVTPTRVLDTRNGTGAPEAKIGANGTIAVNVEPANVVVPANMGTISAVVMNLTATDETGNGVITAYPDSGALPSASNLNFSANKNIANLVTVKVGADDKVDLHNGSSASTDLIGDVEGYYVESTTGDYYLPNSPTRVLDTRTGTGGVTGAVGAGATISLSVPECTSGSGSSKVTATAEAVALNVTAVSPTANGVVTVYPDAATLPEASNLNYYSGENVPSLVVVAVGADGKVEFHNGSTGSVQLVADLEGCYSTTLGSAFVPITPYRALDTRNGIGQESAEPAAAIPYSQVLWYPQDEAPAQDNLGGSGIVAAVMNVTVTQSTAGGVITAYPTPGSLPTASNLNFTAGETVPNLVMVSVGPGFNLALYNGSEGTTDLIADMFGYFS